MDWGKRERCSHWRKRNLRMSWRWLKGVYFYLLIKTNKKQRCVTHQCFGVRSVSELLMPCCADIGFKGRVSLESSFTGECSVMVPSGRTGGETKRGGEGDVFVGRVFMLNLNFIVSFIFYTEEDRGSTKFYTLKIFFKVSKSLWNSCKIMNVDVRLSAGTWQYLLKIPQKHQTGD